MNTGVDQQLKEIAFRIKELREIAGYSQEEMARKTEVTPELYRRYELGELDFPFTFIHFLTIGVIFNAMSMSHTITPVTYIFTSIRITFGSLTVV